MYRAMRIAPRTDDLFSTKLHFSNASTTVRSARSTKRRSKFSNAWSIVQYAKFPASSFVANACSPYFFAGCICKLALSFTFSGCLAGCLNFCHTLSAIDVLSSHSVERTSPARAATWSVIGPVVLLRTICPGSLERLKSSCAPRRVLIDIAISSATDGSAGSRRFQLRMLGREIR